LLQQSLRDSRPEAGRGLCAEVSCSSCCNNPACTNWVLSVSSLC
jgi:hypothetical protein